MEQIKINTREVELINLTPHEVSILTRESGQFRNLPIEIAKTFYPSGTVARVSYSPHIVEKLKVGDIEIAVTRIKTFNVTNLPEPKEGVAYIVSKAVAEVAKDRQDLYVLFGLRREKNGRVLGGTGLSQVKHV